MAQKSDASGIWKTTFTFDPASLATVTDQVNDVAVPGVLGDCDEVVNIIPPASLNNGLLVQSARVKSGVDGIITIEISNVSTGTLDAASGTWIAVLGRFGK